MPSPIKVEVVCPGCRGEKTFRGDRGPWRTPEVILCSECNGTGKFIADLAPDSLAALKIALADAVDRNWLRANNYELIKLIGEHLDAIINHSDYALATPTEEGQDA